MSERLVDDATAIAALLSVPRSWVLQQARDGAMPSVRLGVTGVSDVDDVLAWVESLKSGGGPAYPKHSPTTGGTR